MKKYALIVTDKETGEMEECGVMRARQKTGMLAKEMDFLFNKCDARKIQNDRYTIELNDSIGRAALRAKYG